MDSIGLFFADFCRDCVANPMGLGIRKDQKNSSVIRISLKPIMSKYEEKLSILSEMISLARVNQGIKDVEFEFLWGVAEQLGVDREDFESLFDSPVKNIIPKTLLQRIIQFHRLVLLMNVDREQTFKEIDKLHNIGLRMGLPPSAIDQVLVIMHQYPDMIIPPKVLVDIFKAHYN